MEEEKLPNPYSKLLASAAETPCKLTEEDVRALFRLEQWMHAYCRTRRGGHIPPHSEVNEASAYYMVSNFKTLLMQYGKNNKVFDDVNRLFDKVTRVFIECMSSATNFEKQTCIDTEAESTTKLLRAKPMLKVVADPDAVKTMTHHNLEHVIAYKCACVETAFWNPLDVSKLAWNELLRKLSAVAAIEKATKTTCVEEDSYSLNPKSDDDDDDVWEAAKRSKMSESPVNASKTGDADAASSSDCCSEVF
jgi:hypothetical protein